MILFYLNCVLFPRHDYLYPFVWFSSHYICAFIYLYIDYGIGSRYGTIYFTMILYSRFIHHIRKIECKKHRTFMNITKFNSMNYVYMWRGRGRGVYQRFPCLLDAPLSDFYNAPYASSLLRALLHFVKVYQPPCSTCTSAHYCQISRKISTIPGSQTAGVGQRLLDWV